MQTTIPAMQVPNIDISFARTTKSGAAALAFGGGTGRGHGSGTFTASWVGKIQLVLRRNSGN